MRRQFLETMLSIEDPRAVMLFGDVSVYLFDEWKKKNPERFHNVGICENTIVGMGAGMASQGFIPFMHTINPFITERCAEQIKLDFCHNRLGGNIVSCGASFDYAWDGATHHCFTDLLMLSKLPNTEVMQPGSKKELDVLLRARYANDKLKYYRLSDHPHDLDLPVEFGRAVVLKDGYNVTVMTAGPILGNVVEAVRDLHANLVYFHTIKPIDAGAVLKFRDTRIIVVHDAYGLHEAVTALGIAAEYHGVSDFYDKHGTVEDARRWYGLDPRGIREKVQSVISLERRRG